MPLVNPCFPNSYFGRRTQDIFVSKKGYHSSRQKVAGAHVRESKIPAQGLHSTRIKAYIALADVFRLLYIYIFISQFMCKNLHDNQFIYIYVCLYIFIFYK